MAVAISRAVRLALLAEAAATPDREACGLLFGTVDSIVSWRAAINVSSEPETAFEIDPAALFSAQRAERNGGPQVIGYYHSHPNGRAAPSAQDQAMAARDGRLWVIVADDDLTSWRASAGGLMEEPLRIVD